MTARTQSCQCARGARGLHRLAGQVCCPTVALQVAVAACGAGACQCTPCHRYWTLRLRTQAKTQSKYPRASPITPG